VILANGLFNGLTALGEGTVTASGITYSPLALSVPDDGSVTLTVKLSVKTSLPAGVDNKSFQFRILPAGVTAGDTSLSSQFAVFAAPLSVATENRVEIVATALAFTDQPELSSYTGLNIAPVAVTGRDGNGNTDDDYTAQSPSPDLPSR